MKRMIGFTVIGFSVGFTVLMLNDAAAMAYCSVVGPLAGIAWLHATR